MYLQVKTLVACPTCSAAGAMSKQREKSFSLLSVCQGSDLSQPAHTTHTHPPPLWGEIGLGELSPEATAMPLLSAKLSRLWDFINQASSSHFFGCPLLTWSQLCLEFLHSWGFQQFSDGLQVCCSSMVSPQPYTTFLLFPFPHFPAVAFCLLALIPPFWAFSAGDPCISRCTSRCQLGLAQASQLPEDLASSGRCRKPCLYCQWDVAGTSRRH